MIRKRKTGDRRRDEVPRRLGDVHEWARSLPWVVERSPFHTLPDSQVRVFAVDCEPLERRQVWLLTGLVPSSFDQPDVAVVMPRTMALEGSERGWVIHSDAPLPEDHVLVALRNDTRRDHAEVEALLLAGYCYALM
jgi:hypothetical protein